MKLINKDILTVTEGIIAHQANCRGAMGKGLAKQIADKKNKRGIRHDRLTYTFR